MFKNRKINVKSIYNASAMLLNFYFKIHDFLDKKTELNSMINELIQIIILKFFEIKLRTLAYYPYNFNKLVITNVMRLT